MDGSQNGGRDSRYNMGYDLPPLLNSDGTTNEMYNATATMHGGVVGVGASRQTSINSNLVVGRGSNPSLSNSCSSNSSLRGIKRNSADMCYDQQNMSTAGGRSSMLNMSNEDCSPVMMENSYSPGSNQKGSPPSNGKKTKGRVKIKMEYIDNKLRRYTTFSKRKTGIMKKAYELSTLTGTQVMLLVASETGHVYTFATRKLQPMITSEAGKALIQTCLNSPDPFPTGTGDQRMSATGFEETELSYNVADDEKADSASSSPYHTDSSDSCSDTESISPASPMVATASITSTANDDAITITAITATNSRSGKSVHQSSSSSSMPGLVPLQQIQNNGNSSSNNNNNNHNNNSTLPSSSCSSSSSSCSAVATAASNNDGSKMSRLKSSANNSSSTTPTILYTSGSSNSLICSFEQLEREFGIQAPRVPGGPHFIKIPLPNGVQSVMTPPAAHQTPADLSNKPRR